MKKEKSVVLQAETQEQIQNRLKEFATKLESLQEEYKVKIYPANQAQQNGEVIPMIKIVDINK